MARHIYTAVARPTVQRYFEVLVDTLIGVWLRARQPRLKVHESEMPDRADVDVIDKRS